MKAMTVLDLPRSAIAVAQACGIFMALGATTASAAPAPTWRTWGLESTTGHLPDDANPTPFVPFWLDTNLDGAPDPIFITHVGFQRLEVGDDGQISAVPLTGEDLDRIANPGPIAAPLDADGDGIPELLFLGDEAVLLRVIAPDVLAVEPIPLPPFLVGSVGDMAVGDLNRDGLPDVYLGIGVGNPERLLLNGREDAILMGRGGGRFDVVAAEPTRRGLTNGVTLADFDGDGRLDVVESVDVSTSAGFSRLLMNRTPPGASVPVLEPAELTFDVGTSGMGAAVADIDGDGHLDIYNTSVGYDLFARGLGDGGFEDQTLQLGFRHHWATLGVRIQWSPTFADFNGDGLLDTLVRHGRTGDLAASIQQSTVAPDLLYVQEAGEGLGFRRVAVPFDSDEPEGRRFAVGDIDSDGLPDVARDGVAGTVRFWHNTTELPPDTRTLSVRFAATVSGTPPTGARVIGTCGGLSLERLLTSGGKTGAAAAAEVSLAWPDCVEAPTLVVHWPSGAVTGATVADDATSTLVAEPRWLAAAGDQVSLDPAGTGAVEACVASPGGDDWVCCSEACELARPAGEEALQARLDTAFPTSLPSRAATWILVTDPPLPRPGAKVDITLLHVGGEALLDEVTISLDGEALEVAVDATRLLVSATATVAFDTEQITLTARRSEGAAEQTWDLATGMLWDPANAFVDLYPVRDPDDDGARWEVHVHSAPGSGHASLAGGLKLTTVNGWPIPFQELQDSHASHRRVPIIVEWDELHGLDTVLLRDAAFAEPLELPVTQPVDQDALVAAIGGSEGAVVRSRMGTHGDVAPLMFTFVDDAGNPMPTPAHLVDLEVVGGSVFLETTSFAFMRDSVAGVRTGDVEPGPAEVILRTPTGDVVGVFPFTMVHVPAQELNMAGAWADISTEVVDAAKQETVRVRAGLVDEFDELVGGDVLPEVTLVGGEYVVEPGVSTGGAWVADIAPLPGADEITIELVAQGETFGSFVVEVLNPTEVDPDPAPPRDGCAACQTGSGGPASSWLLMTLVCLALALRSRRSGARSGRSSM